MDLLFVLKSFSAQNSPSTILQLGSDRKEMSLTEILNKGICISASVGFYHSSSAEFYLSLLVAQGLSLRLF